MFPRTVPSLFSFSSRPPQHIKVWWPWPQFHPRTCRQGLDTTNSQPRPSHHPLLDSAWVCDSVVAAGHRKSPPYRCAAHLH
jgi:hypothetical protein